MAVRRPSPTPVVPGATQADNAPIPDGALGPEEVGEAVRRPCGRQRLRRHTARPPS